jgi:phage-related minor tail protein
MTPTDTPAPDQPLTAATRSTAELQSMQKMLNQIDLSANRVAMTLAKGFGSAIVSGKSFNETLTTIGQSLARLAIRDGVKLATQALTQQLAGLFADSSGEATTSPAQISRNADGGVIASPTYFANGGAIGLMGERGAEAIMPLARGDDGRLGVIAQNPNSRPVAVTVNIAATDIDSFRRSEAQLTGALARAVARGQRFL